LPRGAQTLVHRHDRDALLAVHERRKVEGPQSGDRYGGFGERSAHGPVERARLDRLGPSVSRLEARFRPAGFSTIERIVSDAWTALEHE
jgi:hypothetical protein